MTAAKGGVSYSPPLNSGGVYQASKKGKPSKKMDFTKKIKTDFILKPKQPFFSLLKVL